MYILLVQACFVSKNVSDVLSIGDTIDSLVLDISDPENQFQDVVALFNGSLLQVSKVVNVIRSQME